jgi:F-box protein 18 (helicase)
MPYQLTLEQSEIVRTDLKPGEILKIIAFAGTGKTTTLFEYTKERPKLRFLYVAFNKSVQIEASAKFPKNVRCRTAHSLAWPGFGVKFREKLVPDNKAYMVRETLNLSNYEDAKHVISTLYNYLISADPDISKIHIPKRAYNFYRYHKKHFPDLVELAKKLWSIMRSGDNQNAGMIHDGYLKLYQLSRPKLNFDCILLDEAQDINPVIADIVVSQKCSKIIVGDPHQQIYSFRGAQDILSKIDFEKIKYLTQSFRFTNKIAQLANLILQTFKGENKRLVGLKSKNKKKPFNDYTYITRTNAFVFDKAAELHKKKRIGFVGGLQGYRFSRIEDAYFLQKGEKERIKNRYIAWFNSYNEMKGYAQSVDDWELLGICKVVEKYDDAIPRLIRDIKNHHVDQHDAEVLLTTAHKSKGLEWENTFLADDFPPLIDGDKIIDTKDLDPDEFNLIYVAITRSKQIIRASKDSSLEKFILKSKTIEKRHKSEPAKEIRTREQKSSIISSKDMPMKKRQFIYMPEINRRTFLFFYRKGDSYSLREYPKHGGVILSYGKSYPYTADKILDLAKFNEDAPTHPVTDENFWREKIDEINKKYLTDSADKTDCEDNSAKKPTEQKEFNRGDFTGFFIHSKNNKTIKSVNDWLLFSPPKMGRRHWKDGRSAKELAKAWLETGKPKMPRELKNILQSHPLTRNFIPDFAIPEYVTRLDKFFGEHRNHDLIISGMSDDLKVLISIEAKADESFGKLICNVGSKNPNSKIPQRLELLKSSIFGLTIDDVIGNVRYQLLTGVAGALIEAKNRGADISVFIVHEFLSKALDYKKLQQNSDDFEYFVQILSGKTDLRTQFDELIEIESVPGGDFVPGDMKLLIGKTKVEVI